MAKAPEESAFDGGIFGGLPCGDETGFVVGDERMFGGFVAITRRVS